MERKKSDKIQSVQVISRAADILRALAADTDGLSLGQIAARVDLPRSTVQRIVTALSSEGLISSDRGIGGIKLGPMIQTLAQSFVMVPKDQLRPVMINIAQETGETVDLAILQDRKMLFIDQIVGGQRLRTVSSIGERFPLTTTANGKAALACLDEAEATKLAIAELKQKGGESRKLAPLLAEIAAIRDGELARDEDEHTDGVSAMGFAVRGPSLEIFAISVPVPSSRYDRVKDCLASALLRAKADAN